MESAYTLFGAPRVEPSHEADGTGNQPRCTSLWKCTYREAGLFILLLVSNLTAVAQQDPLYSQYIFNPFIINPAYAGFSKDVTALASYRRQWAGFEGSPVTMNATGHMALFNNRMGLGLTLLQDKIGTNKTTEVLASYAYHVAMSKGTRLSFGLQAGVVNYRNDFDELTIDRNDPKFQNNISELSPSFGVGVIFSSDKFFLSMAVPKMLDGVTAASDDMDVVLYNQQFYGMGSYLFTLSHRLKLKPYVLARLTSGAPANTDFGVALNADDSYTLGLFTRNMHTYGAMMKINLGDMLRIGYIFELPTNKSVGLNYPAHEFTLGIRARVLRFHDLTRITDF